MARPLVWVCVITSYFHVISASLTITTLAGGSKGYTDGNGAVAQFQGAFDSETLDTQANFLLVTDPANHIIRQIDLTSGLRVTTTFAGLQSSTAKVDQASGFADDFTSNVRFVSPGTIHALSRYDATQLSKPVIFYVSDADATNPCVRRLKWIPNTPLSHQVISVLVGSLGTHGPYYQYSRMTVDVHNDAVYVVLYNAAADHVGFILVTQASSAAPTASLILEVPTGAIVDGGVGVASINNAQSLTLDTLQAATTTTPDLYFSDGNTIRRLSTGATPSITTIAGQIGVSGYQEGVGTNSKWGGSGGLFFVGLSSTTARIYVTDAVNQLIRALDYDTTGPTYTSSLVAGVQGQASNTDGGVSSGAKLLSPGSVHFDGPNGILYFTQQDGTSATSYVREITGFTPVTYDPYATITGDPQFVGVHGQQYQVHGIPGEIFNLISSPQLQLNSLFTYIDDTRLLPDTSCLKHLDISCYSHPGTYLTNLGIMMLPHHQSIPTYITATLHMMNHTNGTNGDWIMKMSIGKDEKMDMDLSIPHISQIHQGSLIPAPHHDDTYSYVEILSSHHFMIHLSHHVAISCLLSHDGYFSIEMRVLQMGLLASGAHQERVMVGKVATSYPDYPLHGLIGQSWRNVEYMTPNGTRYYAGEIDDYLIQEGCLFGTNFMYNQFNITNSS